MVSGLRCREAVNQTPTWEIIAGSTWSKMDVSGGHASMNLATIFINASQILETTHSSFDNVPANYMHLPADTPRDSLYPQPY